MAVKIRLARKGRKRLAYYHIVVADGRSPRDGRYIEKIGKYNPLTNPATIELDFDKALGWLQNGAIPTETCRAILSYKGVLIKKHLLEGVRKGAFDETEATKRFDEWMKKNQEKIDAKRSGLEKSKDEKLAAMIEAEKKINEARAAKLAKKQADLAAREEAAAKGETPATEESSEIQAETTETEEVKKETIEETAEADTKSETEVKEDTTEKETETEAGEEKAETKSEAEAKEDTTKKVTEAEVKEEKAEKKEQTTDTETKPETDTDVKDDEKTGE